MQSLSKERKTDVVNVLGIICWGLALVCYFFQFPFKFLSSFIIIFLFAFIFCQLLNCNLQLDRNATVSFAVIGIYLVVEFARGMAEGNSTSSVIRFMLILCALLLCSLVKKWDFKYEYRLLIIFAVLKSLILIIGCIVILTSKNSSDIRYWLESNEYGSAYVLGFMPRFQVQGNALLLAVFIIDAEKNKKLTLWNVIILIGVIGAGNVGYMLGIAVYVLYVLVRWYVSGKAWKKWYAIPILVLAVIAAAGFVIYFVNQMSMKSEGNSAPVRLEEARILLNCNWFFGEGLGNTINAVAPHVVYNGDIYFELQTLYIVNQIGFIGLIGLQLFICKEILIRNQKWNPLIIYFIYLLYAFFNPHCYDTVHMIVIILLMNVFVQKEGAPDDNKSRFGIQSGC